MYLPRVSLLLTLLGRPIVDAAALPQPDTRGVDNVIERRDPSHSMADAVANLGKRSTLSRGHTCRPRSVTAQGTTTTTKSTTTDATPVAVVTAITPGPETTTSTTTTRKTGVCHPTRPGTATKTATAAPTISCNAYSDPDNNGPSGCQCDGYDTILPYLTASGHHDKRFFDVCGYTAIPTRVPTSSHAPFYTTIDNGEVFSCATSSWESYAVNTEATCAGASKVISTVVSLASSWSSSVSAASSSTACNPLAPAATQWEASGADDAWNSAVEHYQLHHLATENPRENFIWSLAKYFGWGSDMDCAQLAPDNNCQRSDLRCEDVKSPAARVIGNSLGALNGAIYTMFDAYVDKAPDFYNSINAITADFSDFPTDNSGLEVLTTVFGVLMPLVMTPILSGLFATIDENTLFVTELVEMSSTFTQDFEAVYSGAAERTILGQNAEAMLSATLHSLTKIDDYLFNGSAIPKLHDIIAGGQLLEPHWVPPRLIDIMDGPILDAFQATFIPLAWQNSVDPVYPVIIDSKAGCDEDVDKVLALMLSSDVAEATGVCIENIMYYGVKNGKGRQIDAKDCSDGAICYQLEPFGPLPGMELLGQEGWRVTYQQIVQAAVNTYKHHGKNGGGFANAADQTVREAIYYNNFTAPGVNTIPVCEYGEIEDNLSAYFDHGDWTDNFPCN